MAEIQYLEINDITRMINVPANLLLGVREDKDVKKLYFKCKKIVEENVDLSKHQIYVKYINALDKSGKKFDIMDPKICLCGDVTAQGDYITFSWLMSENVFAKAGLIAFSILASDGEKTRWNTYTAIGTVLNSVPGGLQEIAGKYPDIITQLLNRMREVEKIATKEAMQEYVNTYLTEHPGEIDETLTDPKKAAPADVVGSLKEDIEQLKQNGTGTGTGLSTEAIDKLEEVGNYLAYTTADGGSKWTELISILRNGSSGDSGGTEVTISSISATYTGGDVEEGTALSDLTGITVIATYSDGSTATVTGYTLSGEIAEGENTITVSYGGKTTTFTVIGTASVSAGETIVYNVFTGEYINSGFSGDNYTIYGANYKIYQEEIDVTDASTLYYRFGRNNKVTGATQSGLKLGVYSSDGSVLGVLDLSDSSTVTKVDGKYDINGLETLDDGTVIYGIYVASVSLSSFENKSYVKFAVLSSSNFVPSWNGNAQSTSVLSLEV